MSDDTYDNPGNDTWKRWEMADLSKTTAKKSPVGSRLARRLAEEGKPASAPAGVRQAPRGTTAIPDDVLTQVARIGQNARDAAAKEGYAEGLKKGRAEGMATGKAEGLKNGHDEGFQAGHREGYEKGLAEGREISASEVNHLQALMQSCAASVEALDTQISESLVDLALNIARQVIRSSLEVQPEKVLDTVRDILAGETGEKGQLRLRLNPEDLVLVKRHLSDDPRLQKWHLQADERIERGGCLAETALGNIDATLKTRWERIAGTLREHPHWGADA